MNTSASPQNKADITVLIPIYTAQPEGIEFLKSAIQSVLRQTFSSWTLIVLDDASPISGIQEAVKSFGDGRLTYLRHSKNLDQAENWNSGKRLVETEFFCILHADDELMPSYLSVMKQHLDDHKNVSAAHCKAIIINDAGKTIQSFVDYVKQLLHPQDALSVLTGEAGLSTLLKGNIIMCPTVMFRTHNVKNIDFSGEGRFIVDWEYWCRLLLQGHQILSVPETCFRYRRHHQSATAESRKADVVFREELAFFKSMEMKCLETGFLKAAQIAREKRIILFRTLYFLIHDLLRFQFSDSAKKVQFLLEASR